MSQCLQTIYLSFVCLLLNLPSYHDFGGASIISLSFFLIIFGLESSFFLIFFLIEFITLTTGVTIQLFKGPQFIAI